MRRVFHWLLASAVGCAPAPVVTAPTSASPASARSPMPPSSASPPGPSVAPGAAPAAVPHSEWEPGQLVVVRGRVSTTPWQHVMSGVAGKKSAYFDLEDADHQTVIYWAEPLTCSSVVEVTGRVLEVRGTSKRPGGRPTKVDSSWRELHVDVDSARCVD